MAHADVVDLHLVRKGFFVRAASRGYASTMWLFGLGMLGPFAFALPTQLGSAEGSHPQFQAEPLVRQVDHLPDQHDRLVY